MAVRNWWIEADVDGRKTPLSGGPRSKDGGFQLNIYQRVKGDIDNPYRINAFKNRNGYLVCQVYSIKDKKIIHEFTSERD